MKWIHGEQGPSCYCGQPTVVAVNELGEADLLCYFHEKDSGAVFPLPSVKPEKWPHLTDEELDEVMFNGQDEFQLAKARSDEQNKFGLS